MPRVCTVCTHPDRAAIDAALVEGRDSISGIARKNRRSADAVTRHAKAHLSAALANAHEAGEEVRGDALLAILHEAKADARRLRDRAEKEGDLRCAVAASRSLFDVFEKLYGVAEKLAASAAARPTEPREIRVTFGDEPDAYPSAGEKLVPVPEAPAARDREAAPAPRAPEPDPPPRRPAPPPPAAPPAPPAVAPAEREEAWRPGGYFATPAGQRTV